MASSAEMALNSTRPQVLDELSRPFRPRRRPRRFDLATMVWLGIFGAAHAVERSMEEILASEEWQKLVAKLTGLVTNFQYKVIRASGRSSIGR